jgi:hypothetical protein
LYRSAPRKGWQPVVKIEGQFASQTFRELSSSVVMRSSKCLIFRRDAACRVSQRAEKKTRQAASLRECKCPLGGPKPTVFRHQLSFSW